LKKTILYPNSYVSLRYEIIWVYDIVKFVVVPPIKIERLTNSNECNYTLSASSKF